MKPMNYSEFEGFFIQSDNFHFYFQSGYDQPLLRNCIRQIKISSEKNLQLNQLQTYYVKVSKTSNENNLINHHLNHFIRKFTKLTYFHSHYSHISQTETIPN